MNPSANGNFNGPFFYVFPVAIVAHGSSCHTREKVYEYQDGHKYIFVFASANGV